MVVELLSVGTEILLGNIVNTNAAYLAEQCAALGLSLYYQTVVGDNEKRLEEAIRLGFERSDILILTGGLGPTKDDLTKETVARVFGKALYEHVETKQRIQAYFEEIGHTNITQNNWKQALVPEDALVVNNHNGTAPGLILSENGKTAILLPGPPNELKPMFERDIYPYLNKVEPEGIYSKMIKICSIGESKAEEMVADILEEQTNPTIAPYAKTGEVHLRITAKALNEEVAEDLIIPMLTKLRQRFGSYIYTEREEESLEQVIVAILEKQKIYLATAESCTGGLLAGRIVNAAGVSKVYKQGFITYANEAKEDTLGVKRQTLDSYGAVSKEVASEMAIGAKERANADVAISITGIAGPDGGTNDKPVGLVYVACALGDKVEVQELHLSGNREKIRDYAVVRAMTMLREELLQL